MVDIDWLLPDQNSPSKGCGFENDLIDYLSALKWPEFSVKLPALGNFNIDPALIIVFSSLGSFDEKWLAELTYSMSSGFSEDKTPLGLGQPRITWPTVEDVRCS
nr:tyrosyl-dna phosphodiesterase 1 [Quercus suber]